MEKKVSRHKKYEGSDYIGASIFLALGVTFLFNNFNLIPWTVWPIIFKFWPVLIILLGLKLLFGRNIIGNFL